jgi:hypothetical protein
MLDVEGGYGKVGFVPAPALVLDCNRSGGATSSGQKSREDRDQRTARHAWHRGPRPPSQQPALCGPIAVSGRTRPRGSAGSRRCRQQWYLPINLTLFGEGRSRGTRLRGGATVCVRTCSPPPRKLASSFPTLLTNRRVKNAAFYCVDTNDAGRDKVLVSSIGEIFRRLWPTWSARSMFLRTAPSPDACRDDCAAFDTRAR